MKRLLTLAACAAMAACTTPGQIPSIPSHPNPITPERCAAALSGIDSATQIIDMLGTMGIGGTKAQALAGLLALGKLTVPALCALLNPIHVKPLPAHPDPLPRPANP